MKIPKVPHSSQQHPSGQMLKPVPRLSAAGIWLPRVSLAESHTHKYLLGSVVHCQVVEFGGHCEFIPLSAWAHRGKGDYLCMLP